MVKEILGDITTLPDGINFIVHQANTHQVMGAGIAKILVDLWPEVREADLTAYRKVKERVSMRHPNLKGRELENVVQANLLGGAVPTREIVTADGRSLRVINLYGQRLGIPSKYGFPTDYDAVRSGFKVVRENLTKWVNNGRKAKLGIPYGMGCGLGGADWNLYLDIIKSELKEAPFETLIVKYQK